MPLAPPATSSTSSPAPSVIPSMWARLEIVCPLEWMTAGPPPIVPMTYPFHPQFTPDLTNSLLIAVGMYVYSITCPLILTSSPTAILNLPSYSFCLLDTALVLTSDNVLLNFSPSIPCNPLMAPFKNSLVTPSLSYVLLIEKDGCDRWNISIKFPCVCMCLSYGDCFNFWYEFSLSFPLFCVKVNYILYKINSR